MMLQAVAHDVKNKLAELAMRLLERDIEAAALALDSADKLAQALLLDNPDQLAPQIEAACPADLLEEMAAVYGQLFPNRVVATDVSVAPTLWYYDAALMRLALSNALHNACKHSARSVHVSAYERNGYLVFEVRNDGETFPPAVLNRNWEDGSLADTGVRLAQSGGTGLGLLLSHKIVHAHTLDKNGLQRCGHLVLANDPGAVARLSIP